MKLLIPISLLKEECALSMKVDDTKYKAALRQAQLTLKSILGPEFYEEIETQYNVNNNTFTTENNTLYTDYIQYYLAWETYLEYLPLAQLDSTGTGLRVHNDSNSELASDLQFFSATKAVRQKAENYRGLMINFIKLEQEKDAAKYPLYRCSGPDTFSFGISSVSGGNGQVLSVHKAIIANE